MPNIYVITHDGDVLQQAYESLAKAQDCVTDREHEFLYWKHHDGHGQYWVGGQYVIHELEVKRD